MTNDDLAAIEARHAAAKAELGALCDGRDFRMRMPVEGGDSDVRIDSALDDVPALVGEVKRLQAELQDAFVRIEERAKDLMDQRELLRRGDAMITDLRDRNAWLERRLADAANPWHDYADIPPPSKMQLIVRSGEMYEFARFIRTADGPCWRLRTGDVVECADYAEWAYLPRATSNV